MIAAARLAGEIVIDTLSMLQVWVTVQIDNISLQHSLYIFSSFRVWVAVMFIFPTSLSLIITDHVSLPRSNVTLQEYDNTQQLTDHAPIKEILGEPHKTHLRSRRPFAIEAARLASLNQTEKDIWAQSWSEGVPPDMISGLTQRVRNLGCPGRGESHQGPIL